jgi:hypothetical protein
MAVDPDQRVDTVGRRRPAQVEFHRDAAIGESRHSRRERKIRKTDCTDKIPLHGNFSLASDRCGGSGHGQRALRAGTPQKRGGFSARQLKSFEKM